jgi:hypothetical protein
MGQFKAFLFGAVVERKSSILFLLTALTISNQIQTEIKR